MRSGVVTVDICVARAHVVDRAYAEVVADVEYSAGILGRLAAIVVHRQAFRIVLLVSGYLHAA